MPAVLKQADVDKNVRRLRCLLDEFFHSDVNLWMEHIAVEITLLQMEVSYLRHRLVDVGEDADDDD